MEKLLHTYSDGSKLSLMSAKALTRIPIWKGNRIIDLEHAIKIKESIDYQAQLLDSGYKIIQYNEIDENENETKKSYVIDGQHRIRVVMDYFENVGDATDFLVTVTEIYVDSEADAIDYFNKINNVKPIQFEEDPILIVNKYIQKLIGIYPKTLKLFRNGATKRPYMSIDKLRTYLSVHINNLKKLSLDSFVMLCNQQNNKIIQELEILSLTPNHKEIRIIQKSIEIGFGLAWDEKFRWLGQILNPK